MNFVLSNPLLTLGVILLALVLPPTLKYRSWKKSGVSLLVASVGVVLPLFIFFFSAFLVPDWKGGCRHGWIDCFHLGKLALTPIVLWATAALYAVEVFAPERLTRYSVALGLVLGTTVAAVCFLFGVVAIGVQHAMALWLLVPLYIAVWHGIRARQMIQRMNIGVFSCVVAFLSSLPFWVWSVIWSRHIYTALPNKPPDCFVVTAASRGHKNLVGPFLEVRHNGQPRRANLQLIVLWQFEALWRAHAPGSHAAFRRAYNSIGPAIARCITSPWLADAVYVVRIPAALLARLIVLVSTKPGSLREIVTHL